MSETVLTNFLRRLSAFPTWPHSFAFATYEACSMAVPAWLPLFQLVIGVLAVQTAQAALLSFSDDAHPTSADESRKSHYAHPWRLEDPGIDLENGIDLHASSSRPLENVQVHHPPRVPQGGWSTTQLLLKHDFANSYCELL